MMEMNQLKAILEAAIFAAGEPVTIERLAQLFDESETVTPAMISQALQALGEDSASKVYHLKEVATGFRFQVNPDYSQWLIKLWEEKPSKYSKAVLETLVLVAYRQPITRAEVEDIRGVTSSSHIFKTLMDRDWVKVVGHKDVPGRPSLYATTKQFLDYFNLQSLQDLPTLAEIMDLDKAAEQLIVGQQLELPVDEAEPMDSEQTMMAEFPDEVELA